MHVYVSTCQTGLWCCKACLFSSHLHKMSPVTAGAGVRTFRSPIHYTSLWLDLYTVTNVLSCTLVVIKVHLYYFAINQVICHISIRLNIFLKGWEYHRAAMSNFGNNFRKKSLFHKSTLLKRTFAKTAKSARQRTMYVTSEYW